MTNTPAARTRLLNGLAWGLHLHSAIFFVGGLLAMFLLSPKVLYADPWRFVSHFLSTPRPWSFLDADNGHREVLPNLIRIIELDWLQGNQWLQIVIGALLACASVAVLALAVRSEDRPRLAKAAALFFAVAGIFWLGNVRSLAHGNESVHAYLVTLCLIGGSWMVSDPRSDHSLARLLAAAGLGLVATFSFGSGIACFVAYAAAMVLRRAPWRGPALMAGTAVFALVVHLALGNARVGLAAGGNFLQIIEQVLRWLSAPFLYIAWPLLDSSVSAQIPLPVVRAPLTTVAEYAEHFFGPAMQARWPNVLIGLTGLCWLLASSHACWRSREASRVQVTGLGIAWFALAVGVMVAVTRSGYFLQYPEQVVAPRYLPWSSLFWSGLAMATVIRSDAGRATRRAIFTLLVAAALLPSQTWMAMLAHKSKTVAEITAAGAAVGVLGEQTILGETVFSEMATARPLLEKAGKSVFAWPETRAIGTVPAGAQVLAVQSMKQEEVANRFGGRGMAVTFALDSSPCARLALVDDSGRVVGLALRQGWSDRWQGWAKQTPTGERRVVALCQ